MQSTQSGWLVRGRKDRPTKRQNSNAGFSLIEVLAALLVTMLLVLTFTPFVSQMLATWASGGEAADLVELKTRGLGQLREDLRHAIVWMSVGQIQDQPAFEGDETSMSFPVAAGLGGIGTGIEYLSFRIASGITGRALVRRRAAIVGSSYGGFVDPVVLFSGPFRYVFRYYSRGGEQIAVWNKGQMDLPGRVELDIFDRNSKLVFELPVALPTFASLSAGCVAGRGGQGCPAASQSSISNVLQNYFGAGSQGKL